MGECSTKQGCDAGRGLNPQGSEKGRRGMAFGLEAEQEAEFFGTLWIADSPSGKRWRGKKPHGRNPWQKNGGLPAFGRHGWRPKGL